MTPPAPAALPAALAHLATRDRWMLWRLDAERGKVPVHPLTGLDHAANDPAAHVPHAQALAAAAALGRGLAYVFMPGDGMWFVDVDDCLEEGGWSELAAQVAAMLPGAACEVSQSGRGLHFFGRGTPPPHRCKRSDLGLELYHEHRFVALTGTSAVGDAGADLQAYLPALVDRWFRPDGSDEPGERLPPNSWRDEARADWVGPEDDDLLLGKMLAREQSLQAALRGRATLQQLWSGDETALALAFPTNAPGKRWGESEADAALAQHLAYWTGCNTERVRRLMLRSGLVREKWARHRQYLWTTITRACARQSVVLGQRAPEPAPQPVPEGQVIAGGQIMTPTSQVELFRGCVYVSSDHAAWVPDGRLLTPERFRAVFGGYTFSLDGSGERAGRDAWEAFTQGQGARFPRAEGVMFRPEDPRRVIDHEGHRYVNAYVPVPTRRVQGDAGPFLRHVERIVPDPRDREQLLCYMASLVQHPGAKFQWCPLVQGAEGNGKTLLSRVLSHAVGERYTHMVNPTDLADGHGAIFNSWITRRLLVVIEEIQLEDREDVLEMLKPLVTNERVPVQFKGVDAGTADNRANFLMMCNRKESATVGVDKRRYFVVFCAQQTKAHIVRDGMGGRYFPELYAWLKADGYAIVNDWLRTKAVPAELDPRELSRAPESSSTAEMVGLSLSPVQQDVVEAVAEGRRGFAGGWVNSFALQQLLERTGRAGRVPPNARRRLLAELGYVPHPGLAEGRVSNSLPGETGKARLYVREGSPACDAKLEANVVRLYLEAQGGLPEPAHIRAVK